MPGCEDKTVVSKLVQSPWSSTRTELPCVVHTPVVWLWPQQPHLFLFLFSFPVGSLRPELPLPFHLLCPDMGGFSSDLSGSPIHPGLWRPRPLSPMGLWGAVPGVQELGHCPDQQTTPPTSSLQTWLILAEAVHCLFCLGFHCYGGVVAWAEDRQPGWGWTQLSLGAWVGERRRDHFGEEEA